MPPRRSKAAKPASQDRPADSDSDDIVIVAGHEGVPSPLAGTPSPTRVRGAGVSRAAHRVASANLRAKEILAKRQRLGEYTPGAATTDGDAAGGEAAGGRQKNLSGCPARRSIESIDSPFPSLHLSHLWAQAVEEVDDHGRRDGQEAEARVEGP